MTDVVVPLERSPSGSKVIISDSGQVKYVDKTVVTSGDSFWVSKPQFLNDPDAPVTLRQLFIGYVCDEDPGSKTLDVYVSGDGGSSWEGPNSYPISDTNGKIAHLSKGFSVTGRNLRIKFVLPYLSRFRLVEFSPVLVQRGNP